MAGNISSEKIDLLVYGPNKPIVDNGFSDQFVLHPYETNFGSNTGPKPWRRSNSENLAMARFSSSPK